MSTGGSETLTPEKVEELRAHALKWRDIAYQTGRMDREGVKEAARELYRVCGLKTPAVAIATSPLVLAISYGLGIVLAGAKTITDASLQKTVDSISDVVRSSEEKNKAACRACVKLGGQAALKNARNWVTSYQGGCMSPVNDSFITAARDVLGAKLPNPEKYASWEYLARHSGFRVVHEDFCIITDHPDLLSVDRERRAHGEDGPSHLWQDGYALYSWHGTKVPDRWIKSKDKLTAAEVLRQENLEIRRAGIDIVGWDRILSELGGKIVAEAPPEVGILYDITLPDVGVRRLLKVRCGTGRKFAVVVPNECKTPFEAQSWLHGFPPSEFELPEIRT